MCSSAYNCNFWLQMLLVVPKLFIAVISPSHFKTWFFWKNKYLYVSVMNFMSLYNAHNMWWWCIGLWEPPNHGLMWLFNYSSHYCGDFCTLFFHMLLFSGTCLIISSKENKIVTSYYNRTYEPHLSWNGYICKTCRTWAFFCCLIICLCLGFESQET